MATNLSNLKPAKGSKFTKKRVGRGPGSGSGKTASRGYKGAQSRSGYKSKRGFEGGQMPLHRRMPKRGFNNIFRKDYSVVNLGTLQHAVDEKKIDAKALIDVNALVAAGIIAKAKDGVRLLAKGELTAKLTLKVAGASKSAVAAVEKAGGTVELPAPKPAPLDKEAAKALRAEVRAAKAAAAKK